nr:immunoglobulin light chain junction region [Macaca mulatta]MOV77749.1 immunoglobulin light chain junction region [Macaca mulatta]MOV77876.1 immunoglobulin light chain junction region [Macaca mulatta]MOV77898.1 immunoglobulin light chain junction region [Macaca mulatta]MOV78021.1 immunoglobulin light chain junction region [Macaca mulatta]
CMQALDFPLTF